MALSPAKNIGVEMLQPLIGTLLRDRPVLGPEDGLLFGSDVIADAMRELHLPYIAMVPGSSFRGLHDSIVNRLGNTDPQIVLCLHEEHAVAVADGYARAAGRPIAVGLHANVGLMHATMPIYNAWCDRVPMIIIGANGPADAHLRRPWIDWVHSTRDQALMIRGFIKWDDQPVSTEAALEAILRAYQITTTLPYGPTYVCLDVTQQEAKLEKPFSPPDVARFAAPPAPAAPETALDDITAAIRGARQPLFLFGRMSRDRSDWDRRVALAEAYGAAVMSSIHNAAAFPTGHAQHLVAPCAEARTVEEIDIVRAADLIVAFDWMDLAGFLRSCLNEAQTLSPTSATVVHASLDGLLANGWSMDHQALAAVDHPVLADPDTFVSQLLDTFSIDGSPATSWDFSGPHWVTHLPTGPVGESNNAISLGDFAMAVRGLADNRDITYVRFPLSWPRAACRFTDPLSYLGKDGGGAVGVGPGTAVGAALALQDSGRIVAAVLGDGDTLMGINALWTASHMDLPLLVVVANNVSYFNDELHQERVAKGRGRPVENRWIGQRLAEPEIDIIAMAKAQGFDGEGPVRNRADLEAALERGARIVASGGRCLIDARIEPGYAAGFGLKESD